MLGAMPASPITPAPHPFSAARWRGLRVGLLGGSFDPAHAGHMHIAIQAMIRLHLDAVWWLVSPGNVLKTAKPSTDYARRIARTREFVHHPRMAVTDIEGQLGTRYTRDTLRALKRRFPATHFIWIAGMDNAATFDRWAHWRALPRIVPFAFFERPPALSKIKAKRVRQDRRLRQRTKSGSHRLKPKETGVFWMTGGPGVDLSSTFLRRNFAQGHDSGV